jgi:hypothetical protein
MVGMQVDLEFGRIDPASAISERQRNVEHEGDVQSTGLER